MKSMVVMQTQTRSSCHGGGAQHGDHTSNVASFSAKLFDALCYCMHSRIQKMKLEVLK
jgi:hypothetical protein